VPWRIESTSGPYGAPWEGKDVTGWVWEIYDGERSTRILVEVSGSAMATEDQFLPTETAHAKATEGRSEVEKVLDSEQPPRRITLGTTGYADREPEPDLVIKSEAGKWIAVVEVTNPETLTIAAATVRRDQWRRPSSLGGDQPFRFLVVLSQDRGFLFDYEARQYQPVIELSMLPVIESYYPVAGHDRLRGSELEIVVFQWLRDLTLDNLNAERLADQELRDAGFVEAVRGAQVEVA
jgi:hypothetical protein